MNATKHRRLMTILTQKGINEDERHELVYAWTRGRTTSSKDLFDQEIDDLIWKIEHDAFFAGNLSNSASAILELEIKRKRSVVLAIAQRCGIHEGTDFKKFNAFMMKNSILKKRLSKYTFEELDELIKQFHKLEANFKKSAEKAGTKAWHKHFGVPEVSDN